MLTRSKQLYAARNTRSSDTTYQANLFLTDDGETALLATMKLLGQLKTEDFARAQKHWNDSGVLPARTARVKALHKSHGLTTDYARAIVESNDMTITLAAEANERNIAQWQRELDAAPAAYKHLYQRKIDRAGQLRVCLGGKKLFRDAQRASNDKTSEKSWQKWHDKRLFLECGGTATRVAGNRQIRLVPTNALDVFEVSVAVWVDDSWQRKTIGTVHFKRGARQIHDAIDGRAPVSIKIIKRGKNFRVHVTPSATAASHAVKDLSNGKNAAGIDLNSHHFDVAVLDRRGNPSWHRTYFFGKAADEMDGLVKGMFKDLEEHGVSLVAIERLKGIQANRSSKQTGNGSSIGRKAANQLPTTLFKQAVVRNCRANTIELAEVSPAGTSADTKFWPEQQFGTDTHQKSGFLTGRRGLGLSLRGRHRQPASGRRRMSAATGVDPAKSQDNGGATKPKTRKRRQITNPDESD